MIIPHLYNGRNKTFFFANYEGFRQNTGGQAAPASVPLADEMNAKFDASVLGNFTTAQLGGASATLTQCGHTYHVGDPHPLFNPFDPSGCPFPAAADGSYTIPTGSISQLGKLVMRPGLYYPAGPNTTGPSIGVQNYLFPSKSIYDFDQQNYRIDQSIGAKDLIFVHLRGTTNRKPVLPTLRSTPQAQFSLAACTRRPKHTRSPPISPTSFASVFAREVVREPRGRSLPRTSTRSTGPMPLPRPGRIIPVLSLTPATSTMDSCMVAAALS